MDLTPVRIRGKKRNRALIQQHLGNTKRPRPSYSANPFKPNTITNFKSKSNPKPQTIAAMPTLQGLPQEILEMIFLCSMNISLPRSCPSLGRRLSSPAICLEYFTRIFFNTVDHRPNVRHQERIETSTSDPDLQSELLACRFVTFPFFLTYVSKAHSLLLQQRGKAWAKTGIAVPDASYFDGLWPFKFTKITYLGFAEGFRIPERLLHGPWTEDKASLLYVLVSLNGEIDWEASMAGETAREGMREALHEGNERAVAALSVLLGIAQEITTDVLRYAVTECGCKINLLRHLLFNAQILTQVSDKTALNFHDPVIWNWAERHESEEKSALLKDMLRKAEHFSLEFYTPEDCDWRDIVSFPYSGPKFDPRTRLNQLSRELLVKLYQNHGRRLMIGVRGSQRERMTQRERT
ncbi:hypothetical protein BCR34DRAFT_578921 [Clohesyomyces aquaticus]|uniref:Uncharacterized protein n=1 Tax=Clohesyomyces aquaticus TaxID=1231657 RepID=A0A1Y1YDI2_9PLEO|nr:hypothetical protein BCR34DRAFT_578921 [Clohesyomyces aquaticus]